MKFSYQARTKEGEIRTGVIEAASKEAAVALLQKYRLYVTFLEEAGAPPIWARRMKIFERISHRDIVIFSRQLSIMFKSKIPLIESLRTLAAQIQNPNFKEVITDITNEVETGTTLSGALSRHPELFSSFYTSMVKSGELSGTLSQSLDYLADHLEREYNLFSRVKGAMIYPALILLVMGAVLALIIFFVMPQLISILEQTQQELPLITKIVIALCNLIQKWGWLGILGLIILAILLSRFLKTPSGKKIFDQYLLKTPIFGLVIKKVYLARFAENLSVLVAGGIPINQALEITGDIVGNAIYKEAIFTTREEVSKGETISQVLAQYPDLFPPIFIQMTLVGEKTGTLDKTLLNIVDFYQKEVEREIEGLLSLLEPVLILILGGAVGILVGSILLPLYQLTTI